MLAIPSRHPGGRCPRPNTCGVIVLTHAAEFALHLIWHLQRVASAESLYQSSELHQVRNAEERALPTQGDLRLRSNEVRPLRWNRANAAPIDIEQKAPAIAVEPLAYADQLPPGQWMVWMRHTHKAP